MSSTQFITRGHALTLDQIMEVAPAAFATQPSDKVSDSYGFVPTYEVIATFLNNGFVVSAARGGMRGGSRIEGAHEIRFRSPDEKLRKGNYFSEIAFTNSHNRESPSIFNLGLYKVACDNGMIVPTAVTRDTRRIHSKFSMRDIMAMAEIAIGQADRVEQVVERWTDHKVEYRRAVQFAIEAENMAFGKTRCGELINTVRRPEDRDDNLWCVFNRVQENLLVGGVPYTTESKRSARTRPVTSMLRARNINLGLWKLAEAVIDIP